MSVFRIGDMFARLMTDELGYKRFAVRATDLGTGAAMQLGLANSNSIIGLHLSGANPRASISPPEDLSETEKKFVADIQNFWSQEGAYAMIHSN